MNQTKKVEKLLINNKTNIFLIIDQMTFKNFYADWTNKINNLGIKIKSIRYYGNKMKPQLNL